MKDFLILTGFPKPRAVSLNLTTSARQIPVKMGICHLNPLRG